MSAKSFTSATIPVNQLVEATCTAYFAMDTEDNFNIDDRVRDSQ